MKNFKLILGVLLWIITGFSIFYLYNFSERKNSFISIYTRVDSTFYKDVFKRYKLQRYDADEFWYYLKIEDSSVRVPDAFISKIDNSYYFLDSIKKNNLINLNFILNNLPQNILADSINNSINESEVVQIGEKTTNQKVKQLYQIWLTREYEKLWIAEMKSLKVHYEAREIKRIKGDSIGVFINSSEIPDMYLKQEIDINEDQNKFSITTHYFGKDTLTIKKNYRITTPKGQKIKPFDYEEIE